MHVVTPETGKIGVSRRLKATYSTWLFQALRTVVRLERRNVR
jgi:hypothetical protein